MSIDDSRCTNNSFDFVSGEPGSHVFGSISDGVFHGQIISRGSTWYVEKAHYYFAHHEINETLHSVIYHESDVVDPYAHLRTGKIIQQSCLFVYLMIKQSIESSISSSKNRSIRLNLIDIQSYFTIFPDLGYFGSLYCSIPLIFNPYAYILWCTPYCHAMYIFHPSLDRTVSNDSFSRRKLSLYLFYSNLPFRDSSRSFTRSRLQ